jgi:hypothetical protein
VNIVNVKAIQDGERSAKVLWHIGKEKNGAIDVVIPFETSNVEALAELAVLRYLTLESDFFSPTPRSGHGILAVVSKGAIKKAQKGKSQIPSIQKYSRFLNGRLQGIELKVNPKVKLLPAEDTPASMRLELTLEPHDTIETPALGPVQITDHAYERWLERVQERSQERPYDSLVKRLQSQDLSPVVIPEKTLKHKIRKYGEGNIISVYRHPTEPIHYGFLKTPGGLALVTVFVRNDTLIAGSGA